MTGPTPPLVVSARRSAGRLGLPSADRDEDGPLLHVLAARRGVLRVAEIGSRDGVGTAWLAAALPPGVPLFACEASPDAAAAVRAVFGDDPDAIVLEGDWRALLPPYAPFDLLVVRDDSARDEVDAILGLACPGGTIVLAGLSADRPGDRACREAWLRDERVVATVVGTGGTAKALLAVVRR